MIPYDCPRLEHHSRPLIFNALAAWRAWHWRGESVSGCLVGLVKVAWKHIAESIKRQEKLLVWRGKGWVHRWSDRSERLVVLDEVINENSYIPRFYHHQVLARASQRTPSARDGKMTYVVLGVGAGQSTWASVNKRTCVRRRRRRLGCGSIFSAILVCKCFFLTKCRCTFRSSNLVSSINTLRTHPWLPRRQTHWGSHLHLKQDKTVSFQVVKGHARGVKS